jgi:hypothetical protein
MEELKDLLGTLFLKLAALGSYCGGPLLLCDRLKPHLGTLLAFLVTFIPVGFMLFASFFLEDDLKDRMARFIVMLGRQALYLVLAMHAYALWCFLNGFHAAEPYLYYAGIGIGIAWSIFYLRAARQWAAAPNYGTDNYRNGRPIVPS